MEAVVAHATTPAGAVEVAALLDEDGTPALLREYLSSCLETARCVEEKRAAVEAAVAALSAPRVRPSGSAPAAGEVRCRRPATVYHVTTDRAWRDIEQHGLIPVRGVRSTAGAESEPRVFLFGSREDVDDALGNWLGEEFEDYDGDLVVIEMETPSGAVPSFPDAESSWEWSTPEPIPAAALSVVDRC